MSLFCLTHCMSLVLFRLINLDRATLWCHKLSISLLTQLDSWILMICTNSSQKLSELEMASLHALLKHVISVKLMLGEDLKTTRWDETIGQTSEQKEKVWEKWQLSCPESDVRVEGIFFVIRNILDGHCGDARYFSSSAGPHPTPSFTPPLLLSVKQRQAPESALR